MSSIDDRDTESRAFTVRLPPLEHQALKAFAQYTEETMASVVLKAIRLYLSDPARENDVDAMLKQTRARVRETIKRVRDG